MTSHVRVNLHRKCAHIVVLAKNVLRFIAYTGQKVGKKRKICCRDGNEKKIINQRGRTIMLEGDSEEKEKEQDKQTMQWNEE